MFRSHAPVAEVGEIEQGLSHGRDADLIPLSHIGLDLPAPGDGWAAYLTGRGIPITEDDIGRQCISRADAKQLFDEHRENEARQREAAARVEAEAILRDREFRASLPRGLAWYHLPDGVSYAQAAAEAEAAAHPRRTPSRGEWLFGETDTMVYHELPQEEDS
jgi:hypothetical protein